MIQNVDRKIGHQSNPKAYKFISMDCRNLMLLTKRFTTLNWSTTFLFHFIQFIRKMHDKFYRPCTTIIR